ncbi:hypothetical protein LCGC14_1013630 [marine sediment metagenome]|uniref:Uncharacterized protein n=1 Tax=marine sediment metagenome TaxID=412755 RepID=A0A0F9NL19_9ZZZZ
MEKHSLNQSNKRNGGITARIGKKFHAEIVDIQKLRIKNDKTDEKTSMEKITNSIIRSDLWKEIKEGIANLDEREINEFGL